MAPLVAGGSISDCPTVPSSVRSCLAHAPCVRDAYARVPGAGGSSGCIWCAGGASRPSRAPLVPNMHETFARSAAAALASTASSRSCMPRSRLCGPDLVDVDFRVLGELVELELDRYGGTSDRAGRANVCGDGCGSVGKILRAIEGATKSFGN